MIEKELRIGVISDTHARTMADLPDETLLALSDVDLIVHAGDFTEKAVLDGLMTLGEIKAVAGNMDGGELRRILPRQDLFNYGGKKIGLVHGWGVPWGLAERVRQAFPGADIVIFGHSHEPFNRITGGTLLFNPGRARDSFGIITIGDTVEAEIVRV
jgi:putative phosphoesterase